MILAVVEDLIFQSKIESAARAAGALVKTVGPGEVLKDLEKAPAAAVLIDLNHRSGVALDTIRALKLSPAAASTRIIGYLSHVQVDLAAAALAAGCDQVMARSALVQQLPQILRACAEPKAHEASK
jgi:DNA-binding NarL/FixJ family response regulator